MTFALVNITSENATGMGRDNFCRVRNFSCVSKRDIQRIYALNSYGETDKTRGTGTVVRGRIGKCQYGLQFGKETPIFVYKCVFNDFKVAALVDSGNSINIMSKTLFDSIPEQYKLII
jgi:hypothetical protein